MHQDCYVEHVITTSYYAILVGLALRMAVRGHIPVQQGFKYEAMWLRAADYKEHLQGAWAERGGRVTCPFRLLGIIFIGSLAP